MGLNIKKKIKIWINECDYMQRVFDIIFSMTAIIFFLPFFIPICILLRFTGEGEVFYFQKRIGIGERPFYIIKFATMKKNSVNMEGGNITKKNDPRILPLGSLLRSTKINELPQLFNIVMGSMSIIGPRPLTEDNFSFYDIKTRKIISKVRPGLSGVGSIFFRDEEKLLTSVSDVRKKYKNEITPYKGALEVWYVENRSLKLYFFLIFLTIGVLINPNFRSLLVRFKTFPKNSAILEID